MSVIIGHASQDENKKISGGIAGDQTGKEVCTRTWYAKNWNYVLRCTNPALAEKMAIACEQACNNPAIGYDQGQRNTLRSFAYSSNFNLAQIKTPCECDCSSLMAVCAECAGIKIPYSGTNAPTTRTMRNAFTSTGYFQVLTESKYTATSDYLMRGDILVKEGSHTVMALSNGKSSNTNTPSNPDYEIGKTYTLISDLYIREEPFGEKMKFSCITVNAQANSTFDDYGNAILKKGTRVTCKSISKQTDSIWLLIPSGWVCGKKGNSVYIQ